MARMPHWINDMVIDSQSDAARTHSSWLIWVVQVIFMEDVRRAKRWAMPMIQAMATASNAAQRYLTTDCHQEIWRIGQSGEVFRAFLWRRI